MIRNDDYFEIIKEQNKELAKFRPFRSAYEMKKEIDRLNNIIDRAIEYLKDNACYNDMGNFNDDLDYDKCGDLLDILKGSDKE